MFPKVFSAKDKKKNSYCDISILYCDVNFSPYRPAVVGGCAPSTKTVVTAHALPKSILNLMFPHPPSVCSSSPSPYCLSNKESGSVIISGLTWVKLTNDTDSHAYTPKSDRSSGEISSQDNSNPIRKGLKPVFINFD